MTLQHSFNSAASMRNMQIPVRDNSPVATSAQTRATPHSTSGPSRPNVIQHQHKHANVARTKSAIPDRVGPPYVRTRYLLMYWEGCNDFKDDLRPLKALFDRFGFHGDFLEIPVRQRDASETVRNNLSAFKLQNDGDNELHILVYGGHGKAYKPAGSHKEILLLASDRDMSNYVWWNDIQNEVLFSDERDTIFIPDCCYAGAAQRAAYLARKDILAACDAKHETPEGFDGDDSFTGLVVKAMRSLADQSACFTPRQLYDKLCKLRSRPVPFYQPQGPPREIQFCRPSIWTFNALRRDLAQTRGLRTSGNEKEEVSVGGAVQGHPASSGGPISAAVQPTPPNEFSGAQILKAYSNLIRNGQPQHTAVTMLANKLSCSPQEVVARMRASQQHSTGSLSASRHNELRPNVRGPASDEDEDEEEDEDEVDNDSDDGENDDDDDD